MQSKVVKTKYVPKSTSMFIPKLEHMYFKIEEDIMVALYCNCQLNGLWVMPALMTDRFVNRWLKTWENNLLFTFSFSAPRAPRRAVACVARRGG